ncbi:MAG: saccharopine dehydrogenase NADP-binding domain-containing protein [candidate division WOR-3 bacterium]|nr:saccharopine dehydrogenase NADP-binding domain-containing protein [candidate division WOR-3 bacterium]
MNICILGAGLQGRIVAWDLAQMGHKVTLVDVNRENLRKTGQKRNISVKLFDVTKREALMQLMQDFEVVVGALPASLGYYAMQCAVRSGIDIVDMSYSEENPLELDKQAKKKKVKIVPDAGFAPGLSNILIGEAYRELGGIDSFRILVGGIPQNPILPLNYKFTWSPSDLVAEYTRPARIVNNYKIVKVEALTGIEQFSIPKIGQLECFYTDGLRSLLHTFKDIKNMEEKTIRYAGHSEIMRELLKFGFCPSEPNPFTNSKIKPKTYVLEFLQTELNKGDDWDLTILLIDIKSKNKSRRYYCLDYYDKQYQITSMARMTAYTCSIITQCIKDYPACGVIAPEFLGMNKKISDFIKSELKKRRIIINQSDY